MTLTLPHPTQWADSHLSIDNLTGGWMAYQGSANSASAWGTANRAIYVPIRVPQRSVVLKLGVATSSTSTGNIDIGLYDAGGTRLISTGSTAKAGGIVQVIDVTDTTIGPGLYYLGLNNSTTTDDFMTYTSAAPRTATMGVLSEALGAVTLPATAAWAVDNVLTFVPIVTALLVTEIS